MIRIMLMYYANCYTFLEEPEKDWAKMIQEAKEIPPEPSLFDQRGAYFWEKQTRSPVLKDFGQVFYALWSFSGQQ